MSEALAPAFHFPDPKAAEHALQRWRESANQLNYARDLLIAGASAAGITTSRIHAITGVARTTIGRIPEHPVATDEPGIAALYARVLQIRAHHHLDSGADNGTYDADWNYAAAAAAITAANALTSDDDLPPGFPETDDGALAALAVELHHQAAQLPGILEKGTSHVADRRGFFETCGAIADEIDQVRALGRAALNPAEVQAAEATISAPSA